MASGFEQRPASSPLAGQNHTRTSSFFSFRKGSDGTPQRSLSLLSKSQPNHSQNNVNTLAPQFQSQNSTGIQNPPPTQPNLGPELARTTSAPQNQAQTLPQPLHPEIRSVVNLTVAHAHKIYCSGPLVRRVERQPDGQRPAKDEGWTDVWAQLGGTTLSIWDMKQVQEASLQGKEVPPIYVNITDAVCSDLCSRSLRVLTYHFSLFKCWDLSPYLRQKQHHRSGTPTFSLSTQLDPTSCFFPAHLRPS